MKNNCCINTSQYILHCFIVVYLLHPNKTQPWASSFPYSIHMFGLHSRTGSSKFAPTCALPCLCSGMPLAHWLPALLWHATHPASALAWNLPPIWIQLLHLWVHPCPYKAASTSMPCSACPAGQAHFDNHQVNQTLPTTRSKIVLVQTTTFLRPHLNILGPSIPCPLGPDHATIHHIC